MPTPAAAAFRARSAAPTRPAPTPARRSTRTPTRSVAQRGRCAFGRRGQGRRRPRIAVGRRTTAAPTTSRSRFTRGGCNCVMVDGSVRFLSTPARRRHVAPPGHPFGRHSGRHRQRLQPVSPCKSHASRAKVRRPRAVPSGTSRPRPLTAVRSDPRPSRVRAYSTRLLGVARG